jgi:UDP-GlcNAc:undecaprenyl-phosphate GlcNAc-1-phosphate transferase
MWTLASYLFGMTAVLTLTLTTPAMALARRWGLLDLPGGRKIHSKPIPLAGGWAIFGALSLVLWGHLLAARVWGDAAWLNSLSPRIGYFASRLPELIQKIWPVYAGAAAIFVMGVVDDVRGMSVRGRFLWQVGIALALVLWGVRPNLYFLPTWVCAVLGVLWIVGITNAFNFLDGLDGLSAGVALVSTSALMTIMGLTEQPNVLFFLSALTGSLAAFLLRNWHPASIFLGSSGSLLIGYLLGVFTILATYVGPGRGNWLVPLLTPIFLLAIPLYDTASVVLIRLSQKRPLALGDQSHFHHRLMRLGFSHRQTVAFITIIAFAVALSAVRLVQVTLLQSTLIMLQITGILSLIVLAERVALNVGTRPRVEGGVDREPPATRELAREETRV